MMAEVEPGRAGFRFVRHNDRNETVIRALADEAEAVEEVTARSPVAFTADGGTLRFALGA
jgi:hypothetical protein